MKRLKISHLTEYRFAETVTLNPHQLLLRPREGPEIHIESSQLTVSPANLIKWHRDALDNAKAVVEFTEPAQTLSIASEVVIQHYEENPLDFLVEDHAVNYPFSYDPKEHNELLPFLQPAYDQSASAIQAWVEQLGLNMQALQTFVLLDNLCQSIAQQFTYTVRYESGVQTPEHTLNGRLGSCRDFDPTAGEVTGTRYIPVAVSRHPETVPPVAGSFLGSSGSPPDMIVDVRVLAV